MASAKHEVGETSSDEVVSVHHDAIVAKIEEAAEFEVAELVVEAEFVVDVAAEFAVEAELVLVLDVEKEKESVLTREKTVNGDTIVESTSGLPIGCGTLFGTAGSTAVAHRSTTSAGCSAGVSTGGKASSCVTTIIALTVIPTSAVPGTPVFDIITAKAFGTDRVNSSSTRVEAFAGTPVPSSAGSRILATRGGTPNTVAEKSGKHIVTVLGSPTITAPGRVATSVT